MKKRLNQNLEKLVNIPIIRTHKVLYFLRIYFSLISLIFYSYVIFGNYLNFTVAPVFFVSYIIVGIISKIYFYHSKRFFEIGQLKFSPSGIIFNSIKIEGKVSLIYFSRLIHEFTPIYILLMFLMTFYLPKSGGKASFDNISLVFINGNLLRPIKVKIEDNDFNKIKELNLKNLKAVKWII